MKMFIHQGYSLFQVFHAYIEQNSIENLTMLSTNTQHLTTVQRFRKVAPTSKIIVAVKSLKNSRISE